ncbi:MAG: SDR family NAD(P)-dependent oxidoreductase [Chloroflexota bacterium]|nr:SDR family NAD(P)-dependent oxidoreductase [Chloroflexota bacterium]
MAGELSGKVAVVTGAAGNVGRATAVRFAAGGARLVLIDHKLERVQALAAEFGGDTVGEAADLGDVAAVDALFGRLAASVGQIDVVAHTVGGFASGKPVHEEGIDVLEKMLNLNVRPVFVFCGRAARYMIERETHGKIVVVLARAVYKGAANMGAYTASKAAGQRLVESMALELRDKGINVNAVAPSTIDTPPNRESMPKADFSKWVTGESLAETIAFLASDAAKDLHGTTMEVYGRA